MGKALDGSTVSPDAPHFYRDRIYPFLVDRLGNPAPIRKIRELLIPRAEGTVLELGSGSGANFSHYRTDRIVTLYALEPNPGMRRLAKNRLRGLSLNVEYLDLPGERIPLEDGTVDTVVSTFTLGTIDNVQATLKEIRRVLKPGGKPIFFELGRSPEPRVERRQTMIEPIVHRMYAGLRITRDIPALIAESGLTREHVEQGYIADFPKALTYCFRGVFVSASPRVL